MRLKTTDGKTISNFHIQDNTVVISENENNVIVLKYINLNEIVEFRRDGSFSKGFWNGFTYNGGTAAVLPLIFFKPKEKVPASIVGLILIGVPAGLIWGLFTIKDEIHDLSKLSIEEKKIMILYFMQTSEKIN